MIDIRQQSLTEDLKKQIYEGFSRHAIAMTGFDEKSEPEAFVAMDAEVLAGAIVVAKFWGALHVKYVYVAEAYRSQGLATRLMKRAFAYGRIHKCPFAFVETMNFQALGFYEKMGFHLEFTRHGYAHGTSFHYLRKDLSTERK
jgi:ribosomal protein S18 acetylase RimI-like enzyme